MKRIMVGACGYLDTEHTIANGQTLRTISVINQLKLELGNDKVKLVDYSDWRRHPFGLLISFIRLIAESEALVVFPDERAIRFIMPIALLLGKICGTKIYYVVIGGWLPTFIDKHRLLKGVLLRFDGLFVQTEFLRHSLLDREFNEVFILPNFRPIKKRDLCPIDRTDIKCLKTFYLSRIEPQKGVVEMINVVKRINAKSLLCTLDIYGPVDPTYEEAFDKLSNEFPGYIKYCGVLDAEKINSRIAKYDLQLFPTKYRTEGFPGSVLDSFYAGVPILAAMWDSGREVIHDGEDGVLFEFDNYNDMYKQILMIISDDNLLAKLKCGSRVRGDQYAANRVIRDMVSIITNQR